MDRNGKHQIEQDIDFLNEIKEDVEKGIRKKDGGLIRYAFEKIDDWVSELEELLENRF